MVNDSEASNPPLTSFDAPNASALDAVFQALVECRRCPRLVEWRERVADEKVARFSDDDYWGRPVPGFGDPGAAILIVGLAPAAHGANRTGRMFTGDRSGEFLFAAMAAVGLASQATATHAADGLTLTGAFVTSVVHCAPPANRPSPQERLACRHWVEAELDALEPKTILCLGAVSFSQIVRVLKDRGAPVPVPRPVFGHGIELPLGPGWPVVMASYHPSQHNTFTGRLTQPMLRAVLSRAIVLGSQ